MRGNRYGDHIKREGLTEEELQINDKETLQGWHWLPESRTLGYGDGRAVKAGSVFTLPEGAYPRLCNSGFHFSVNALDALGYAPGPIVCRVEAYSPFARDDDKIAAWGRKVLWMADATQELRLWGVWCARQALLGEEAAGRSPDPRSLQAVEAAEAFARGEIDIKELTAAKVAAWLAAEAAAGSAAWAAEAAGAAAAAAAGSAAESAARAAARAATWAAAKATPAGSATWAAAEAAAEVEQNDELERRLLLLGA